MNGQELRSAKGQVKGCWKLCVENLPRRGNYMYKENKGMELAPENLKEGNKWTAMGMEKLIEAISCRALKP